MGKIILITGATAGFGEATARRFAAEGWRVDLTGCRKARADHGAPAAGPRYCADEDGGKGIQALVRSVGRWSPA